LGKYFGLPHIRLPPPPDSRIISDFPEIFAEFSGKAFRNSVAGQSRWCQSTRLFTADLMVTATHSDSSFGHEWEHLLVKWESHSHKKADDTLRSFVFHTEESAQLPGEEIFVEGRSEAVGNPL
jgi:hypothetical protein